MSIEEGVSFFEEMKCKFKEVFEKKNVYYWQGEVYFDGDFVVYGVVVLQMWCEF